MSNGDSVFFTLTLDILKQDDLGFCFPGV